MRHRLTSYINLLGEITYSERFGFLDKGEDIAGTMAALDRSMVYSTLVGIFPKLHPYLYAILEKASAVYKLHARPPLTLYLWLYRFRGQEPLVAHT